MALMTLDNGTVISLTSAELAELFGLAAKVEKPAKAAKVAKAAEKAAKIRAKHDAILDTKRVERMTETAINRLKAQGFECKASKQGGWVWLYPTNGKGRTSEFKTAKLAKGWKYSPKRGAYYRDFKTC